MIPDDLIYQLALTAIPNIGPVQAKILLNHCNPEEIFHAKKSFLEKLEGIGPVKADAICSFKDFDLLEKEIRFIEKYGIQPLFITDAAYPRRLLSCTDSPILLYYRGEADLNASKVIAVIGTRKNTDYGKSATEKLCRDLSQQDILLVSGLAFGIDAIAHKAALKNGLATVGVLAHGLDELYPGEHRSLAKQMISHNGGLLTEFKSNTRPDRHHFPTRNRIVAGMCDATIVIETELKGGSMITAELANSYNRDVFALPGKTTDPKSSGCNYLIRNNKAILFTEAKDLLEMMNWENKTDKGKHRKIQRQLFIEMTAEEKMIWSVLEEKEKMHIDEINLKSGMPGSRVAAVILNLELQNLIISLPGKLYQLA